MNGLIQLFYLMLPAYVANMTPVFASKLNIFQKPIHSKIFGGHKTWGGLIGGIIVGSIIGILQIIITPNYYLYPNYFYVILLAIGALLGDILFSFFKRRLCIKPGQSWVPFDQIDFVIGALVLGLLLYVPSVIKIMIIIMGSFILHVIVNAIGYLLKLRKTWI